jgi:hypothetical protein
MMRIQRRKKKRNVKKSKGGDRMSQYLGITNWASIKISSIAAVLIFSTSIAEGQLLNEEPGRDQVHDCGIRLLKEAGKTGPETTKLPALYSRASTDKDTQFLVHMLAVIYVESAFNKLAKSTAEAHGLMQMTQIAVTDASKHCNIRPVSMNNLFDSYTNVKYGTCYLSKLLEQMEGDWDRTLVTYNGGYAQLQKYDRGETIATETANYVLKVKRAVKICNNLVDSDQ